MKKFFLYLLRWQLSTPIIWLVVRNLGTGLTATIIANFIGGCIFFWIDKFIFRSNKPEIWYLKKGKCSNCHKSGELYRLVKAENYDRTTAKPKFLCAECSLQKLKTLNIKSIKIIPIQTN
jgi:hypothetical protein